MAEDGRFSLLIGVGEGNKGQEYTRRELFDNDDAERNLPDINRQKIKRSQNA